MENQKYDYTVIINMLLIMKLCTLEVKRFHAIDNLLSLDLLFHNFVPILPTLFGFFGDALECSNKFAA